MYNRLKYKVVIKQPARTIEGEIFFGLGMTAITGPNGSGKSMVLEMIQFAEFGTVALRGATKTYESINVELDWVIKGVQHTVIRSLSSALLKTEGMDAATGTKPVNAAILKLHGYSYAVFKIANLCAQGEIEALGNMLPTARKNLVDEVIGLNALDKLSDSIQKQITSRNTSIATLEPLVVKPEEPVRPEGLGTREFYAGEGKRFAHLALTKAVARAVLAKVVKTPLEAKLAENDARLEEYQKVEAERQRLMQHSLVLYGQKNALPPITSQVVTVLHPADAQLEEYEGIMQERQKLTQNLINLTSERDRLQVPAQTLVVLAEAEATSALHKRWKEKQALILKRVPHDCPKCEHHWEDEDPRIKTEYSNVPDAEPKVVFQDSYIKSQKDLLPNIDKIAQLDNQRIEQGALLAALTDHSHTVTAIKAARVAHAKAEKDRATQAQLDDLNQQMEKVEADFQGLKDYNDAISNILAARINVAEYQRAKVVYDAAMVEHAAAEKDLALIPQDLEDQTRATAEALRLLTVYETQMENYTTAKKKYEEMLAIVEGLKVELADWKAGKAAVVDLRARVKGYIVPALNSVASALLSEMTGGELSWISVSEEFDITVEGQDISTLSGAGKGVANLALRLALGQVLTHKAFPVVMLDEIDASFDNARAAYTAACVRRLSNVFKQVLIVSHKEGLVADNYVQLGEKK